MIPHKVSPDAIIADVMLHEEQAIDRLMRSADSAARMAETWGNTLLADELRKGIADVKVLRTVKT